MDRTGGVRRSLGPGAVLLAGLAAFAHRPPAHGQDMDEGEARVRSRSDVEMRVESGPATNAARLAELSRPLGRALTSIKRCYARLLQDSPTVEGELALAVALPQRGKVRIEVTRNGVEDRTAVRCAVGALEQVSYDEAPRPAHARVRLTFTHSAAAGTRAAGTRSKGVVKKNADGRPEARFGTPTGKVSFTVTGKDEDDGTRVGAVHTGLRKAVPGLRDCRRRAGKRGRSPEGEIELQLLVRRAGRGRARATRSTVAHPRAARCVVRVLGRTRFPGEAAGRTEATVRFAPYPPDEG
ncbi:MAG: hypothetical protein ACOCV4_08130 [Myxococcota bacterium]